MVQKLGAVASFAFPQLKLYSVFSIALKQLLFGKTILKTISFINMKGGVAKTTLCINVADCLQRQHKKRVLVIDIDPQFNATQCLVAPTTYEKLLQKGQHSIVEIFDTKPRPSVSSVKGTTVNQPIKLEDIRPIEIRKGFDLLPGNLDLYKLEMAPGTGKEHRLKKFLELSSTTDNYDYVLLDTPPTPSVWMSSALLASQYFLIPVKPDPISFTGIDLLRRVITELTENYGVELSCAGVVLTMAETQTIVYQRCIEFLSHDAYWKLYLYKENIPKKTLVARTQANQKLILDSDNSDLKYSLAAICNEFLERVENKTKSKIK